MLAPFKNNLDELRNLVENSQTAPGGTSKATGHGVFSSAKEIPGSNGGAGGEPEAAMGSLSALGGPDSNDDLVRLLTDLTKKILGGKK